MDERDLIMTGASVVSGGRFRNVKISGAGSVTSPIHAETVNITGGVKIDGSVESREIRITGGVKIAGDVTGDEIIISGGVSIDGSIRGEKMDLAGGTRIRGALKGTDVRISGESTIGLDMECETLTVHGGIFCGGTVNCGTCDIDLAGESEIKELVGGRITVVNKGRDRGGFNLSFKKLKIVTSGDSVLRVQTIEGDRIELENTIAEVVRGGDVSIGRGCRIGRVEHTGTIWVSQDSKVDEVIH
jgi:cytoskeletal protein CcmA (bactofilin family)